MLHTKGLSEGNYCYLPDMITGLLTILLSGKNRNAYNGVNEKTHCTIAEMAQMVAAKIAAGRIKVVFDKPQRAITPGQALVCYDEELLLGGGTCCSEADALK